MCSVDMALPEIQSVFLELPACATSQRGCGDGCGARNAFAYTYEPRCRLFAGLLLDLVSVCLCRRRRPAFSIKPGNLPVSTTTGIAATTINSMNDISNYVNNDSKED